MKKVFSTLGILALALSMTAGVAMASSSDSTVGNGQGVGQGLDLNAFCLSLGEGSDSSPIKGDAQGGWACNNTGATTPKIDLHAACQAQHPGLNSVKEAVNGDPYTWNCFK